LCSLREYLMPAVLLAVCSSWEGVVVSGQRSSAQVQIDMSVKLFIPQETVDAWLSAERVNLDKEMLQLYGSGVVLRLVPGCYFTTVQAGSDETFKLLGKVKTKAAVTALGAEMYMNSVILGETAYEVEVGFVAKPVAGAGSDAAVVAAVASL